MSFVKKLKDVFVNAIKEHVISYVMVIIASILWAVSIDYSSDKGYARDTVLPFLYLWILITALGILCIESIHQYRKSKDTAYNLKDKKNVILYAVLGIVSVAIGFAFSFFEDIGFEVIEDSFLYEFIPKITICYAVAAFCFTIYFFYKTNEDTTEGYMAKAFCGLMKAELVYMIISLGVLLIIGIFNALIFNTGEWEVIERVEALVVGLVEYPCVLVGLSKSKEQISKFGKIVLSYVFTGLLAVAILIIYAYIIKIIVTFTLPSNEVFGILTALFVGGVIIWTMAQGCCDEQMKKPLSIMPFLFMPFIILQVICIFMRVIDYGLTPSRYMGIAMIIFELIYFGLYIYKFIKKKDLIYNVLFVVIAAAILILIFPVINMESAITLSQKGKIEKYLANKEDAPDYVMQDAYEAYRTIKNDGGLAGSRYIDKHLNEEDIAVLKEYSGQSDYGYQDSDYFYISAQNANSRFDIKGHEELYRVNTYVSRNYDDPDLYDGLKKVPLYDSDGEEVAVVDFSELASKMMEIDKAEGDEFNDVISDGVKLSGGGILYITYMNIDGDYSRPDEIESIDIEGFLVK